MLWILAALSMTVGNLIALRQTNVVRLLGYSSIAQGGFILVPFGAAIAADVSRGDLEEAFFATVTYLHHLRLHEPGCVRRRHRGRQSAAERGDRRLGRACPAMPRGWPTLLALFFFVARRHPAPGRLVRQVRDVPIGDLDRATAGRRRLP